MSAFKTTFVNMEKNSDLSSAQNALKNTLETLAFYAENGSCIEDYEHVNKTASELSTEGFDLEEVKNILCKISTFEECGSFHEYGLSFDKILKEAGDFETAEEAEEAEGVEVVNYYRFQISWGGPSTEVRFYENGLIEFVYLDWFIGIGYDVTSNEGAQWLKEWFESAGMLDFTINTKW